MFRFQQENPSLALEAQQRTYQPVQPGFCESVHHPLLALVSKLDVRFPLVEAIPLPPVEGRLAAPCSLMEKEEWAGLQVSEANLKRKV